MNSGSSSPAETQAFVAFPLRLPQVHVRLRTRTPMVTLHDLQRVLGMNPHEFQAVHRILPLPPGSDDL